MPRETSPTNIAPSPIQRSYLPVRPAGSRAGSALREGTRQAKHHRLRTRSAVRPPPRVPPDRAPAPPVRKTPTPPRPLPVEPGAAERLHSVRDGTGNETADRNRPPNSTTANSAPHSSSTSPPPEWLRSAAPRFRAASG